MEPVRFTRSDAAALVEFARGEPIDSSKLGLNKGKRVIKSLYPDRSPEWAVETSKGMSRSATKKALLRARSR